MVKNGKADMSAKQVKKILVTQPRPDSDKSPYYELSRKYSLELDFHPFIRLEAIPGKEFRKQKIEIQNYTGVIFTSRNAIDHFFRTCEELKVSVSQDTKYFCITEAVALYLQNFPFPLHDTNGKPNNQCLQELAYFLSLRTVRPHLPMETSLPDYEHAEVNKDLFRQ